MNFTIRKATPADLDVIQALNKGLYEYENSLGFYDDSYDLDWTYSEAGTKYFTSLLDDTNLEDVAFLAVDGQQPIGYLATRLDSPTYRSQTPIAEIDNMFVVREARRSGVGSALVDAFKQWAIDNGAQRLKVGAFARNVAVDFYRNCGFHEHEVILEVKV